MLCLFPQHNCHIHFILSNLLSMEFFDMDPYAWIDQSIFQSWSNGSSTQIYHREMSVLGRPWFFNDKIARQRSLMLDIVINSGNSAPNYTSSRFRHHLLTRYRLSLLFCGYEQRYASCKATCVCCAYIYSYRYWVCFDDDD